MAALKALFIGGTGTISSACTVLAAQEGFDLTLLNRGTRPAAVPEGVTVLKGDIADEAAITDLLGDRHFDVVVDFIAYRPEQVARDIRLFRGKTNQYIFISSASAYQKPVTDYLITESTPLANPHWQYSRDKIACEDLLMEAYRDTGFPITIVRPSHTYGERAIPVAIHGAKGSWQTMQRILDGKPVVVHGDGLSWWTFTYNTDFAVGFVGLMGNSHAIGQAVHITSDEKITWDAAYACIGRALGRAPVLAHISSDTLIKYNPDFEGPLLGDKSHSVIFDNSKIKRLVPHFCASIRFDQGIRRTIDFFMAHEEYRIPDPDFDAFCDKIIGV
ncbi:MAG: SDR family oxidoreductase [Oscillospiraceae bacterium]|jgi:nucleoside-diphosphate-sugar epimerase|nr:SDR family oxidoreductase [Oscillospiraceae bacterium]